MNTTTLDEKLRQGVSALSLDIAESAYKKLLEYVLFLAKWNQQYNLTAIKQPEKMISHHVIDSLSIVPHLHGKTFIDIGAGAGLPGIPLAIVLPEKTFTLLDSNGKKTRFLLQAKQFLALDNVAVEHARFEKFYADETFDGILSRGVGEIAELVAMSDHLLNAQGSHFFMKGKHPTEELQKITRLYKTVSLDVPQLEAQRHLIIVAGENHG